MTTPEPPLFPLVVPLAPPPPPVLTVPAAPPPFLPPAPPPPVPTAIYNNSSGVYVTRAKPTSNNSPSNEGSSNAFDNNPYTK